ncbi:hypothetical protein [Actinoplanes regularis]|uniref:Uncharacterized protein n=1 Tax=Actinoplanes regularis TaxID=52697 RepID=A0A238WMX6_9ACTN|nr:hypothetical protein [Actinoplanes regularis]GIE84714.1 hypothetical protein Are01nite_11940 [Actinoplanes regularis]SNR47827.1 hypothetical protein SAMN06264365_102708 [Actinoplanes regularis]
MSSQEGWSPMDRKTAENLLRGDRATIGHPLAELLATAKAPATADELSGEAAAMAAFRAAAHSSGPVTPPKRSILAKLLTLKVAAAAFATTAAVGGVALAANTGALPDPISVAGPSYSASHPPKPSPSVRPKPSGSTPALAREVDDLCREFSGKDPDHRVKALDDRHFDELVQRAGRKDRTRVERFCGLHRPDPSTRPRYRPEPNGLPKTPQDQEQQPQEQRQRQWHG